MSPQPDAHPEPWWVVCLCAAWCGACREWQPLFANYARAHPGLQVAWVDVEDEDDAMGDMDIETFPTVLVGHSGRALHCAPIAPNEQALAHLVKRLQALAQPFAAVPAEAQATFERLLPEVLPRSRL